ncbi:MAG: mitochondrial fission ELM1 family protein, partial [Pseudomonadota bacterium]
TPPWPFLWLAAGRRSAPYTRLVRRRSQEATFTVQILDPKTDPSAFDLVIAPEHDGLTGTNVIRTVGSPSHFSTDRLNTARHTFAHLESVSEKSAIVILGGNSKTHTFTQQACKRITTALEHLANEGWHLRLTTSRRTPHSVTAALRQTAERIGAAFWANEADGPNPYLGWLLHSQVALVTEDSANMLCDAAWHGLPVHMLRLEGRSTKFDRLHTSLIERSCARWFDGTLENWGYPPLREADRVADAIIDALLVKAGVHGG